MTWVKGQGVKPTTGHWMTTDRLNHVFKPMDTTLVATYVTSNTKPSVLLEILFWIWISSLIKVANKHSAVGSQPLQISLSRKKRL